MRHLTLGYSNIKYYLIPHFNLETIDYFGTWGKHMKSLYFKNLRDQQKFNHIPGTFEIGRKDRLWKNLYRLMSIYGNDQFGFIPTSYILPRDVNILREVWKENDEDKWIVKPVFIKLFIYFIIFVNKHFSFNLT
jgi:hypothetical protein